MNLDNRLDSSYWALRIGYGVVPLVAGIDKFFDLLVDWEGYLSPFFARLLPFAPGTFMSLVGLVEIAVGLAVLGGLTRIGAYVASAWLVAIAINLLAGGFFDIAVRDISMSVGAFTLARLDEVRARAPRSVEDRSSAPLRHARAGA